MSNSETVEWLARQLCKTSNPPIDPDGKILRGGGVFNVPIDTLAQAMRQGPRNWHMHALQAEKLLRLIRNRVEVGPLSSGVQVARSNSEEMSDAISRAWQGSALGRLSDKEGE